MYSFDKFIDRRNTECTKYDADFFKIKPEVNYPLWIADMDFEVAPEIMEALETRMQHKLFGYFEMGDRYYNSIINWHSRRYGVKNLEAKHICYHNTVISGISHTLDVLTKEGDPVILHGPVYPGFVGLLQRMNREIVQNTLVDNDGYFTIDFEDFEKSIVEKNIKAYILCNPHNPSSRIWDEEEITKIVDICIKYGVTIISDEIWADLIVNKDKKHLPLVSTDPRAKDISVCMYSPSKGFNLGGMPSAYSICYNEELCEKIRLISNRYCCNVPAVLPVEATIAAYDKAEPWLEACLDYIRGNMDYICGFLETRLPKIVCRRPDATYLLWLDFTRCGITHEEMIHRAIEKAGFLANDGTTFLDGGELHMRLNTSASRGFLEKAMLALEKEFADIAK